MHAYSHRQPSGDEVLRTRHPPPSGCVRGARTPHGNWAGPRLAAQCGDKKSNSVSHCIPNRTDIIRDSAFLLSSSQVRPGRLNLHKNQRQDSISESNTRLKMKSPGWVQDILFLRRHRKRGMERFGKADPLGTGWGRVQLVGKLKGETTHVVLQGFHLEGGLQSR